MKFTLFTFLLILLDQSSKYYIIQHFNNGQIFNILPFLAIYYRQNSGIAFSFLQNTNSIIISILALIIIIYLLYNLKTSKSKLASIGYCCIIGGALGNLLDRIKFGYVIDFIFFHINNIFNFAIFNLADSFITIGIIFIILSEFLYKNSSCK